MSEPPAAFAMHGPEWWVMSLLLLLFAATAALFVLFVCLLVRAFRGGSAPARDSDDPKPAAGGRPTT